MNDKEATHRAILRALSEAEGQPVTGEELGRRLGVSRTAVWKQVQKLKAMGYAIESAGKRGYRLQAHADVLLGHQLEMHLTTRWLGRTYEHHESLGSTNDRAMELARSGAPA
ncbi:MAG: transcriptional repressor, BirA-like, partial [Desulfacinum sp.]|nr:transcriptional repressor, BirA-like [Desulfacinum sp.]